MGRGLRLIVTSTIDLRTGRGRGRLGGKVTWSSTLESVLFSVHGCEELLGREVCRILGGKVADEAKCWDVGKCSIFRVGSSRAY